MTVPCADTQTPKSGTRAMYRCVNVSQFEMAKIHAQSVYQWYEPAYNQTTVRSEKIFKYRAYKM